MESPMPLARGIHPVSFGSHAWAALRKDAERGSMPAAWRAAWLMVSGKLGTPFLRMHCANAVRSCAEDPLRILANLGGLLAAVPAGAGTLGAGGVLLAAAPGEGVPLQAAVPSPSAATSRPASPRRLASARRTDGCPAGSPQPGRAGAAGGGAAGARLANGNCGCTLPPFDDVFLPRRCCRNGGY